MVGQTLTESLPKPLRSVLIRFSGYNFLTKNYLRFSSQCISAREGRAVSRVMWSLEEARKIPRIEPRTGALWVYYLLNLLPTNVISRTLDTALEAELEVKFYAPASSARSLGAPSTPPNPHLGSKNKKKKKTKTEAWKTRNKTKKKLRRIVKARKEQPAEAEAKTSLNLWETLALT